MYQNVDKFFIASYKSNHYIFNKNMQLNKLQHILTIAYYEGIL
jgi:hypothetical protein